MKRRKVEAVNSGLPVRIYQLVRIHNGEVLFTGAAHNVCLFALDAYRANKLTFGISDIPKTDEEIKTKEDKTRRVAFQVAATKERVHVEHANGSTRLWSNDDNEPKLGWWR